MTTIIIKTGRISAQAELNDTPTARKIAENLPFEGAVSTWGEEIYFEIPVQAELDGSAKEVVEEGDLGFWDRGSAFCVFFGPTPSSKGEEIRPYSPVNIIGKVAGDAKVFISARDGDEITISAVETE